VRGQRPRPLNDGAELQPRNHATEAQWGQSIG
jgi:hypothetical protein